MKNHKNSIVVDFKFWLFNMTLRFIIGSLNIVTVAIFSVYLVKFLFELFPNWSPLKTNYESVVLLLTITSFVFFDFLRFIQHFCMHKFHIFWNFHQVHHSATYLTPITLYRVHPIENLISAFRRFFGQSLIFGIFIFLFGSNVNAYDIVGVNALSFVANLALSNLRHSPIPISFGNLENIFLSPAQHQLHHSNDPRLMHSNFGVVLSIWDKFMGSFVLYKKQQIVFGLRGKFISSSQFSQHLFIPFALSFQRLILLARPLLTCFRRLVVTTNLLKQLGSSKGDSKMKKVALLVLLFFSSNLCATHTIKYEFISRFVNESSVQHSGQTFRNVLISDLVDQLGIFERGTFNNAKGEAVEAIWSFIDFNDDNESTAQYAVNSQSEILTQAKTKGGNKQLWEEGYTYSDLATNTQLLNKLAGIDNPLHHGELLGWNLNTKSTPKDLLNYFIDEIAKMTSQRQSLEVTLPNGKKETIRNAFVDAQGRDFRQLIQKFLLVSINFSQITADYLSYDQGTSKGILADNLKKVVGKKYTTLEHHWDEAFGYFGAAKDYLEYSLDDIVSGDSLDTNGNKLISIANEKNFAFSVLAAKRDQTINSHFGENIFTDFVLGRKIITNMPVNYQSELKEVSQRIIFNIEKVIAASVIHYINKTLQTMADFKTTKYSFSNHGKYWSEMKGYALAMQFNPYSPMSKTDFIKLHALLRDQPTLFTHGEKDIKEYAENLTLAKKLLKEIYGFDSNSVEKW